MVTLKKMDVVHATPCQYHLAYGDDSIAMHELIGKQLQLTYSGEIFCIQCGRKTNKSFQQGHCFPCFRRLQECNCMVKPENCRFYEGACDPDDWAHASCGKSHVIYLANSSGLKVGITRASNQPSRWIDQGASQALPFIEVANRYQAGVIEVMCKDHVADKTNWRAMLKGIAEPLDLAAKRDELLDAIAKPLAQAMEQYPGEIKLIDSETLQFDYPVTDYPQKITSYNLDKQPVISDSLIGIKGQYLIFANGVINVRKFGGYAVTLV